MNRSTRKTVTAVGLATVVTGLVWVGTGWSVSAARKAAVQVDQHALEDTMRLADAASSQESMQLAENAPAAAPQGAPLGEAGAAPQGAPLGEAGAAPQGAPLGEAGAAPQGAPLGAAGAAPETGAAVPQRVIPQSSLDLMKQIDGNVAGDPLSFEKTADGRWTKVTFAALGSFKYDVPDPDEIRKSATPTKAPKEQIPAKLKALDGQQVLVVGFMVPIEITREGKVKSFAITQNQQFCCFGVPPAMNEWMMVTMDEGVVADYIMDLPVAAYGQLSVGEDIEDGYVLSVYRMKSSEVISAHELLKRTKKSS